MVRGQAGNTFLYPLPVDSSLRVRCAHMQCSLDKHHQFTLRLSFWDAFKEMDEWTNTPAGKLKIANVAQLLAHAWGSAALRCVCVRGVVVCGR